jgi:hypothetical protein
MPAAAFVLPPARRNGVDNAEAQLLSSVAMKLFRVTQHLMSSPLRDIEGEVARQLDSLGLVVPRAEVAVTAGSRGIDNIPRIVKAVGDWLKSKGARPFIIPAMGSHNGATAEGQRRMLESLGISEADTGMEIRASMDVVRLGSVSTGDVFMDRHAFESGGVMVVNRIKLHTCFSGPVQSGLTKMMVVGMGKINSATTFHSAGAAGMNEMLLEMGRLIVQTGKIIAGVGILEDGFDRTAEIHALKPEDILTGEPALLERHREYFPRLPVDDINVLVVDEIGKNFSGSGMDTNVIGYRGIRGHEDLTSPRIKVIAALGLSARSQGNAFGMGLADFITTRLRNSVDEAKTLTNVLTTGEMTRAKIPATIGDDERLVTTIRERFGEGRWVIIPNTLHLETMYVSGDIAQELRKHPRCSVASGPVELTFAGGRQQLKFG